MKTKRKRTKPKPTKVYSTCSHKFEIIPKSGKHSGIPTWRCQICKTEVKSS